MVIAKTAMLLVSGGIRPTVTHRSWLEPGITSRPTAIMAGKALLQDTYMSPGTQPTWKLRR